MKRIYRDCAEWEEIAHNMWGESSNAKHDLERAISLTGDHTLYGHYMLRVIVEWPISCQNALTDNLLNKNAWIGHAAVALAMNIPEDITRKAWGFLTDEQRILANREAKRAVQLWVDRAEQSEGLSGGMGEQVLFEWNTGRSVKKATGKRESSVLQSNGDCNP